MERLDRMLDYLPRFWNTEVGSVTYEFFNSISEELDVFEQNRIFLRQSIQIDTAIGLELDDIGVLFRQARNPNESDTSYRARIKSFFINFIGGGTILALKRAVLNSSGIPEIQVTVTEFFDLKVRLSIELNTPAEIAAAYIARQAVLDAKAAGVWVHFVWIIDGSALSESILATDMVTITGVGPTFPTFVYEASLIDGVATLS